MFLFADIWEILIGSAGGVGGMGLIGTVLYYVVKWYKASKTETRVDAREQHSIKMEAEETALRHYKDLVKIQDTRMNRMERKIDELNDQERRCWRKYNLVVARLLRHEEIMREAGMQFEAFIESDVDG